MNSFRLSQLVTLSAISITVCAAGPSSASLFFDDFEGTLCQWVANNTGVIGVDPLNSSNHALHFGGRGSGGDIFTAQLPLVGGTTYRFEFDYLGTAPDSNGFAALNNPELW